MTESDHEECPVCGATYAARLERDRPGTFAPAEVGAVCVHDGPAAASYEVILHA